MIWTERAQEVRGRRRTGGIGAFFARARSADAKIAVVVRGRPTCTCTPAVRSSGDSAAPVAVARAAGLHASRIDGTAL